MVTMGKSPIIVTMTQRNVIRQRARQIRQHFQALQTASVQGRDLFPYLKRLNDFEAKLYEYAELSGVHVSPEGAWESICIKNLETGKSLTIPVQ